MSILKSDGLSLLVGDGEVSEVFTTLRGMTLTRLEIAQRLADNPAIGSDAWSVGAATSERRLVLECDALASDDASALRLRSLALSGSAGNFKLEVNGSETLTYTAFVTSYQEIIAPGEIKQLRCRLESSAAVTVVA